MTHEIYHLPPSLARVDERAAFPAAGTALYHTLDLCCIPDARTEVCFRVLALPGSWNRNRRGRALEEGKSGGERERWKVIRDNISGGECPGLGAFEREWRGQWKRKRPFSLPL